MHGAHLMYMYYTANADQTVYIKSRLNLREEGYIKLGNLDFKDKIVGV